MSSSDWGDYSHRTTQQPVTQPAPAAGPVQAGSAALPAEAIPTPSPATPAPVSDAAQLSSGAQAATRKTDWPPSISILPLTTNKQLQDHTGALRQATEKMENDLKSGASPATLQEDAAVLEALMAVQVARDKMDEAILKAFDAAMESARKMMEQYKEWLQKVKIPEEEQKKQQIQQKQLEQEIQTKAAQVKEVGG